MLYISDLYKKDLSRAMEEEILPKIELLDNNLNYIKEITQQVTLDAGSISANRNDAIRRSFSFSLNNDSGEYTWGIGKQIWIDKRVRVSIGKRLSNGEVEYLPQGVFALTQPQDSHLSNGNLVTVECHDLAYFLTDGNSPFINEQTIEEGTNCGVAIKILAQAAGITNFLFDPVTETIPYQLTYSMMSDRWQALVDIAAFCKSEIFFNAEGYLRLKRLSDLNDLMNESAVWKFYIGDGYYSGNVRKMDSEITANHIRVLGGSSQSEAIIYDLVVDEEDPTYGNLWEDNPYSIQKIGRKLYFHNSGNPDSLILDSESAKYRAKFELMNRLSYVERVSLNTLPLYFLEPSDIVEVVDQNNEINGRYRIDSLQIPLKAEMMTIELSKEEKFIDSWDFI